MTQKDILNNVYVRLRGKYTKKEIDFVSEHLFDTLRYYLSNPHECKEGVHLKGFMNFEIRFARMEKVVNNTERAYPERLVNSYKECLKNKKDETKRQTVYEKDDEGCDEFES